MSINKKLLAALFCRPIGIYDSATQSWVVKPDTTRFGAAEYVIANGLTPESGVWYAARGRDGSPLPLTAEELELVRSDEERARARELELQEWEEEERLGMEGPPRPVGVYDDPCQMWRVEPSTDYTEAARYILAEGWTERDGVWYAVAGRNGRPMDLSEKERELVKASEDAIRCEA
jgi:hypothetical protein